MAPRLLSLLAVLAALVAVSPASAQTWPARPVRVVVPFAAGARDTGFIKKLEGIGFDADGNTPAEFAKVLEADIRTWGEAVRVSGAKLE